MAERRYVVYIEDNHNDVVLLQRAMDESGVDIGIHAIETGRDALEYLRTIERLQFPLPHLLLIDLLLPDVKDDEIIRFVESASVLRKIPWAVFTAGSREPPLWASRVPASRWLTKPIHWDGYSQTISRVQELMAQAGA